jgi:hypothetical protein
MTEAQARAITIGARIASIHFPDIIWTVTANDGTHVAVHRDTDGTFTADALGEADQSCTMDEWLAACDEWNML